LQGYDDDNDFVKPVNAFLMEDTNLVEM